MYSTYPAQQNRPFVLLKSSSDEYIIAKLSDLFIAVNCRLRQFFTLAPLLIRTPDLITPPGHGAVSSRGGGSDKLESYIDI